MYYIHSAVCFSFRARARVLSIGFPFRSASRFLFFSLLAGILIEWRARIRVRTRVYRSLLSIRCIGRYALSFAFRFAIERVAHTEILFLNRSTRIKRNKGSARCKPDARRCIILYYTFILISRFLWFRKSAEQPTE